MESTPGSPPRSPNTSEFSNSTALNVDDYFHVCRTNTSSPMPMALRHTRSGSGYDLEKTVPPSNEHRTLVLCFDGTGDQFDDDNSNVVNFFTMLKKDDPNQQLVYYQSGIGTYVIPEIAKPKLAKVHKVIDAMLGSHLNAHVMDEHGDKICLFGTYTVFYDYPKLTRIANCKTARALAGMLHKVDIHPVGLLPKANHQQIPFAYKMYSREDETGWRQSTAFKRAFSIDVDIELLGVWDTVSSVGFVPRRLPFTRSNTNVRYFRHAMALDERRARFQPNFWHRATPEDHQLGIQAGEMPKSRLHASSEHKSMNDLEREYTDGGSFKTHIEEVWFAGCHCDVGGGALPNTARSSLARIPLRWMIRQCFLLNTGILFHANMLRLVGMDHTTLYPRVLPRPPPPSPRRSPREWQRSDSGSTSKTVTATVRSMVPSEFDFASEEEEDLLDALTDIHDELHRQKMWWILELLPQQLHVQDDDDDSWSTKREVHRGRGRIMPRQSTHGVKLHRTVKMRMEALGYKPRAQLNPTTEPTWVD
ncbi:hypothetical protein GGX14DRAFT_635358 [Mycena pura]|uniref:T6SS Phospholipase effector Tle1-like catalytic domain-containing protein n=1 Tax=Mycena pura TaxID=153505 RepID=A0AAD6VB01_9AGAR|nr:hypothetical protein GGX14DRAFT_635358 [Mycena pura]